MAEATLGSRRSVMAAFALALAMPSVQCAARLLAQATTFPVVELRLADFDGWPANGRGTIALPDAPIGEPVDAAVEANTEADTYGAYVLPAAAARQLSGAISALPRIPPADAAVLPETSFPAPTAAGRPGDSAAAAPARLPSVLDLSRSGHVLPLAGFQPVPRGFDPTPDTVQLIFSDMLVHAPGEVYSQIERRGIPYIAANIDFGRGSRICFINSMFIMRSCDGFAAAPPQILCCSSTACRGYTEREYLDTGFPLPPVGALPRLACYATDADFRPAPPAPLPTGPPVPANQQPAAAAAIHAVDFSGWPSADAVPAIVATPEMALPGRVPIRSFQTDLLPGAFSLSTAEATRLAEVVLSQLPEVPAAEAQELPVVSFPGVEARGGSVGGGRGPRARRIPSVYAPFNSGYKFRLDDDDGETAIVNLSNMTLLVPNATYEGLGASGILEFFGLAGGQPQDLVCVQNSIFVLKSCEGFRQAQFELWCCNAVQCNREFTSDFLLQIGAIQEPLDPLTCVELGALSYTPAPRGGAPPLRRGSGGVGRQGDTGVMDNGGMLMRTTPR